MSLLHTSLPITSPLAHLRSPPVFHSSPTTGDELTGNDVEGVLVIAKPWPSIARTVYKDHARYFETYLKPYPGFYFTGDGAARDADGYIHIKGRVDGQSRMLSIPRLMGLHR